MFPHARAKLRTVRNGLFPLTPGRIFFAAVFGLCGVSFLLFDYLFFFRIFHNLFSMKGVPEQVLLALAAKLVGLVLLTTFTMLALSASVSSLSYLYLDPDLELLFALPSGRRGIRFWKIFQAFCNASAMVIILVLPVLFSYMSARRGASWRSAAIAVAGLSFYAAAPAAWGASLTVVLSRFFPARKLHQFFTVLGLGLLTLLVLLFRLARPEVLMNPKSSLEMEEVLASIAMPAEASLPSTWLARSLVSAGEGDGARALLYFSKLVILAAVSLAVLALLVRSFHSKGYCRREERSAARSSSERPPWSAWLLSAMRMVPAGKDVRAVIYRDVLVFFRSPAEWGQLFILAALVVIYLYNIRYMPSEIAPFRIAVTLLNFATLCFVVASVAARFAFTSIGGEGKAFFTTKALPVSPQRYVLAKFLFTAVPLTFCAALVFFFAGRLIDIRGMPFAFFLTASVAASLFLSALAVYMGSRSPLFDERNPAKMLMTAEGLLYMFFSMAYAGLLVVLSARPVYSHYLGMLGGENGPRVWLTATGRVILATLPAVLVFNLAVRRVASTQQK